MKLFLSVRKLLVSMDFNRGNLHAKAAQIARCIIRSDPETLGGDFNEHSSEVFQKPCKSMTLGD